MKVGRLRRKLDADRKGPYPERPCRVCGRPFVPLRKTQVVCPTEECRAEDKRQRENLRTRGELDAAGQTPIFCSICGEPTLAHANSVVCGRRECLLERRRRVDRKRRGTHPCRCIVCGEEFWPPHAGQHYTCSDECQRIARQRRNHRTYEAHREERLAYNERRRAQQAEIQAARAAAELERRLQRGEEPTA